MSVKRTPYSIFDCNMKTGTEVFISMEGQHGKVIRIHPDGDYEIEFADGDAGRYGPSEITLFTSYYEMKTGHDAIEFAEDETEDLTLHNLTTGEPIRKLTAEEVAHYNEISENGICEGGTGAVDGEEFGVNGIVYAI